LPARFSWLGMIHLTKLGLVFRRVTISLASCSLYSCDTVLNIPLRVLAPNWVSVRACWAMPTISAANTKPAIHKMILILTLHCILLNVNYLLAHTVHTTPKPPIQEIYEGAFSKYSQSIILLDSKIP
jgi:hypothetical protein